MGKEKKDQMSKPMYRLVDGKGRVLIPKSMREAAKLEYGGYWFVWEWRVEKFSPEGRGYRSGRSVSGGSGGICPYCISVMPDSLRLDLIGELSRLLQKKEG